MNKFSIIAKSVVMSMGMVGIAHAGLSNWTGFYAGVDAGFAINSAQLDSQHIGFTNVNNACNTRSDFLTFSPGMQLGYMYQFPNYLVTGIEANVAVNATQKDTLGCKSDINPSIYDRFTFENEVQSSIKGRLGRALNWNQSALLPYLTAGASFANVELTYRNEGGDYYSNNTIHAGWLIGAGIEWAFRQHWSLRAEYYYVDYGNAINLKIPSVYSLVDPNGNAHVDLSSNNIVLALNYWI